MDRNEARSLALGSITRKRTPATFRGVEVDVLSPTYADVDAIGRLRESQASANLTLVIRLTMLRGTNVPLFAAADLEALLGMPFGELAPLIEPAGAAIKAALDAGNASSAMGMSSST